MKTVMLTLLILFVVLIVAAVLTVKLLFSSKDHSEYDLPGHSTTGSRRSESSEHAAAAKQIVAGMAEAPKLGREEMMQLMRQQMDERGVSRNIDSKVHPANAAGVDAEWVIAPNATSQRRLLYIHGGGYVMGSAKSHRPITDRLSAMSGAAVLAVNYRLQPENPRKAGIEDCRTAYTWLLKNGPDAASMVETLIVAGDSAGGNLALSTIAWARDSGQRAADAVVVFSPQTDATLASPSLVNNIDTDLMQGKNFGPVVKAPKVFSLGFGFLMNRINPSNPIVSPLLGNLSNLPPTLVQVSTTEMFFDDAQRYVNKANAQGSMALLQTWPFMLHVWQAFPVPEADEAFSKVEAFLVQHAPAQP